MGFFSNIGKTFRHIGQTISKGVQDGFTLGKNTARGVAAFTRPAQRALSVVNQAIIKAEKIPVLGAAIKAGDLFLTTELGFSPIQGLKFAEKALGLFNKLEGRLHEANSVQEFLQQNKADIAKVLKDPNVGGRLLSLLRNAI